MQSRELRSLRDALITSSQSDRCLWSCEVDIALRDLLRGSFLEGRLSELSGRSVLIETRDQLATALALIELDGVAHRVIICPPDLPSSYVPTLVDYAGVDAIVSDADQLEQYHFGNCLRVACGSAILPVEWMQLDRHRTEWVLLTSGTTGSRK